MVYLAREEGWQQREDTSGMELPVRGSRRNRWNRWHTPRASQGRVGGERGLRTEGTQLQTPDKRKGAERHVGDETNAPAAGSRAGVG